MILDMHGRPFPEKSVGQQYTEHLARCIRGEKWRIAEYVLAGWTSEEIRHYIDTGEPPYPMTTES